MGFTIPELKNPVPPRAGNEIQSFVGMLNFISQGGSLLNKIPPKKHRIFLIYRHEFPYIFNTEGGN